MAFERKELNEKLINGGETYKNGDALQPTAVNEIVGAVLNLQESGGGFQGGGVFQEGQAEGAVEIKPYNSVDDETGETKEVRSTANAEGAMALSEGAEAKGKRSKVFAKQGKTGEKALDATVVGQATESNASGNLVGGLRSKNFSPYGITYGKDCYSGVNAQNNEVKDVSGEPYKNSPAVNLGSHNAIIASNDNSENAKVAVGTGLLVRSQDGRQAFGKYNADKDGVWFEFGGGSWNASTKTADRKNVFEILNNNAFRHIGDVIFRREAPTATGEVGFDITSVANGAKLWFRFPNKSGTLALAEDVQGGGGGSKLYLHKIQVEHNFNGIEALVSYSMFISFEYISDKATPYERGTFLSQLPNFFEQQIGKVYTGVDYKYFERFICMFYPANSPDKYNIYCQNNTVGSGFEDISTDFVTEDVVIGL